MRRALLTSLALVVTTLASAVPAAALVVCIDGPQAFDTVGQDSVHTFSCDVHFDAFLIDADNAPITVDGVGRVIDGSPAAFIACLLLPDGREVACEEACGHLLKQEIPSTVQVRVYLTLGAGPGCMTLSGTVTTVFADE